MPQATAARLLGRRQRGGETGGAMSDNNQPLKVSRHLRGITGSTRSVNQRAPIDIDNRSRRKADGHEGEDLAGDIFAEPTRPPADAAAWQHVAARFFRHRGADRGVDDPGRDRVDAYRRQFEREAARQRFQRAIGGADDGELGRGRMLRNPETSVSDPPGRISADRATRQAPQNLLSMVARTSSIATVLKGPVRSWAAVTTK